MMLSKILDWGITALVMLITLGLVYICFKVDSILGFCAFVIVGGIMCGNVLISVVNRK